MLKNDTWIRQQAQAGMISPFVDSLVREVDAENQHGFPIRRKVLSYGCSSYGYDLRLSPKEFLIFKHVPGTVVDPKAFSSKNLEPAELHSDDNGDYFVLPAQSYGLGVAIEYFAVPPNITVICLGKSTLARCFSADTKVKLVDGDYTFLDLMRREASGEKLWGYGVKDGRIIIQQLIAPRFISNDNLLEITLDSVNGYKIRCTKDHVFMLRDGSTKQAIDLKPGDSLHAIHDCHSHGYPSIYDPVYAATLSGPERCKAFRSVHRMVAEKLLLEPFGDQVEMHVHHKDGDKSNNHPENLEVLTRSEHTKLHNKQEMCHQSGGARFAALYANDQSFRAHINEGLHSDESKAKADANARWWKTSETNKNRLKQLLAKRWSDPEARAKQSKVALDGVGALSRRDDITEATLTEALLCTGSLRGAARRLNVDRSAFRRFKHVTDAFKSGSLKGNHKVHSIESIPGIHPTYCLTAPETGNFALSAGVFVHNCGIIVNTTPAEANWEGHLTLEFSNSSGADCRIYANEGIVQTLFFEGEPCEVTYEDRAGKYQNQAHEVTLARI